MKRDERRVHGGPLRYYLALLPRKLSAKVLCSGAATLLRSTLPRMLTNDHQVRVRYAETDRMGYVYYGNYAAYFEVGRVELLRTMGFSYRGLEDRGWMLPVRDMHIRFLAPARYDDLLTVRTSVPRLPGARIEFDYRILSEEGLPLVEGSTTLVFIDAVSMRPVRAPEDLIAVMRKYFDHDR